MYKQEVLFSVCVIPVKLIPVSFRSSRLPLVSAASRAEIKALLGGPGTKDAQSPSHTGRPSAAKPWVVPYRSGNLSIDLHVTRLF